MKCVFVVWNDMANPYIGLLAEALKKESQGAISSEYYSPENQPEDLLKIMPMGEAALFHIHWPDAIYGKNIFSKNMKNRLLAASNVFKFIKTLNILKENREAKIIWTVHDYKSHKNLFPVIEDYLHWNLFRLTNQFIVHTKAGKDFLLGKKVKDEKITIIPHGSYQWHYGNERNRVKARENMGIQGKNCFFLNFGSLKPYKKIDLIISAFNELLPAYSETSHYKLLAIGNAATPQEIFLRSLIKHPNISIVNRRVPDEEVSTLLAAADFFVSANQNILTSGAVQLALSYGLPVIAPKEGDMPYIIQDGENGFLYDRNKERDLQSVILKAARLSKEKKLAMREAARLSVADHTWDFVAKKTLEVYK